MSSYLFAYQNSIVVIAGGTSGIGAQLAAQLQGVAKIVIVLDRVEPSDTAVSFVHVDLNDAESIHAALQNIVINYGSIDYFFNAVGSFMAGEIRDTTAGQWLESMHDNYAPVANATEAIYEHMRSQGSGHIVTLASSAGLFPVPVMSLYGATKSAVVTAMLGLRMEAELFGVKVSVVCPTVVDTPLYDRATYAGLKKETALHFLRSRSSVQKPDETARQILKKTAKNRAVIHTAASTYWAWMLYRISPALYMRVAQKAFRRYRKELRNGQ